MIKQRTLKNETEVTGIGIHSGQIVCLTLKPAPEDAGIIFRRVDLNPTVEVSACFDTIGDTTLCTSLQQKDVKIVTVEHLLSALAGLGIDNAYVDLTGSEVPILDGSAAPFVALIQKAGIKEQHALKKFIRIKKTLFVEDGEKTAKLMPYNGFKISCTIDFSHHAVLRDLPKNATIDFARDSYVDDISRARTFGFMSDYQKLRDHGFAKGASLNNTLVIDDTRILNEGGLRYPDECVKHKILDLIGDLYLIGHNLLGAFEGYKSGHTLNKKLLHALCTEKDAWEYVTFKAIDEAPPMGYLSAA